MRNKGISISLYTAKPHFSIGNIIKEAGLDNYHITDGGSVIINPINQSIVKQHILDKELIKQVLKVYIENNVYTEFYTTQHYYIQKDQENKITPQHKHILQEEVVRMSDIVEESVKHEITKIMPVALDENDKVRVEKMFEELKIGLTLSWGVHPVANPLKFGIITAPGISKQEGAIEISKNIGIPLENILAVGDSTSDWQFIKMCGYGAAMQNASDKLKELVQTKDANHFKISQKSVDENGIIEILDYFCK